MRIPLQVTAKGVQHTDKTGHKIAFVIEVIEEAGKDLINSLKKAVKKGTVSEKKGAQFFGDGKDTVTMRTTNQLK